MAVTNLQWVRDDRITELGYGLLFAEEIEPITLLERIGGRLLSPTPVSWHDSLDVVAGQAHQVAYLGSSQAWSFSFTEFGPVETDEDLDAAVVAASSGSRAVSVSRTGGALRFSYAIDGTLICAFEPGIEYPKTGDDPESLQEEMKQAGLLTAAGRLPDAEVDAEAAALTLLENSFGISLPKERLTGHDLWVGTIG